MYLLERPAQVELDIRSDLLLLGAVIACDSSEISLVIELWCGSRALTDYSQSIRVSSREASQRSAGTRSVIAKDMVVPEEPPSWAALGAARMRAAAAARRSEGPRIVALEAERGGPAAQRGGSAVHCLQSQYSYP